MAEQQPSEAIAALSLRGVSVDFGDVAAVKDVSIDVWPGEFITLLGPSGCGKTTTLRSVAGYSTPKAGEILMAGRRITHIEPQRRRIGMVFQNYALFPHMTVAQNVAFPLRQLRQGRAEITRRVHEMLDLVRMPGFEHRYPRQLSGGQQQRVALARALAFAPTLLLLDEPLSALDRHLREDMQGELKRIQRELAVTTLFVTHDQGEALTLSDRIAVMRGGRIEQIGTPKEVYERPANPFVASFVGAMQFLPGTVLGTVGRKVSVRLEGTSLIVHCEANSAPATNDVAIGLRPENARIVPATGASPAVGVVRATQYLGTHCEVEIECDGAVIFQGVDYGRSAQVGDRIAVEWEPAGMVCFAAPAGASAASSIHLSTQTDPASRASVVSTSLDFVR